MLLFSLLFVVLLVICNDNKRQQVTFSLLHTHDYVVASYSLLSSSWSWSWSSPQSLLLLLTLLLVLSSPPPSLSWVYVDEVIVKAVVVTFELFGSYCAATLVSIVASWKLQHFAVSDKNSSEHERNSDNKTLPTVTCWLDPDCSLKFNRSVVPNLLNTCLMSMRMTLVNRSMSLFV